MQPRPGCPLRLRLTCGLLGALLHLAEGVHNDGQQEVEQHHEHQQLKGPEEEGASHTLQREKGWEGEEGEGGGLGGWQRQQTA